MKTAHELLMNLARTREEWAAAKGHMYVLPICEKLPKDAAGKYETCIGKYGYSLTGVRSWCPACIKRNEAWHAKQRAASRAGAALRSCLQYAKAHKTGG